MKRTKVKIIRTILGSLLLSVVFLHSAAMAEEATWGPTRTTYTMDNPADHVVFNSINDNKSLLGDERKFVRIAKIPQGCSKVDREEANYLGISAEGTVSKDDCRIEFKQSVDIEPEQQYIVYIYYHNNASSSLNNLASGMAGIASDAKVYSSYPELISGTSGDVYAEISYKTFLADENDPSESVWAKARFNNNTGKEIKLEYVTGSAKNYNVGYQDTDGVIKPSVTAEQKQQTQHVVITDVSGDDDLFNAARGGVRLGFGKWKAMVDGHELAAQFGTGFVFGCEPYHGAITYVLQTHELSGSISKEVSVDGGKTYTETVTANPGDTLRFRVTIKNTGWVELTGATFTDSLPKGLTVVPGSYKISTNNSGTWDTIIDREIFLLDTIGTGNTIQITYDVKVSESLEVDCDGTELTNTASLTYDNSVAATGTTKTDTAKVVVTKTEEECAPKEYSASIKKEISVDAGKKYDTKATILPGDTVRYKVTLKNTGTADLKNVKFADKLPKGLTLVAGSVKMTVNDKEQELKDTLSYVLDSVTAGQTIYITYDAIADKKLDADCKGTELTNKAEVSYKDSDEKDASKESGITVTVKRDDKECVPEELPDTGPMEIAMFSMIVLGIAGGSLYLIMAKRELKRLTADATGEMTVDDGMADNMTDKGDKTDGGALNA